MELSRPTIFHLIGSPGVGKYSVGQELAALTGARLVDNHAVANVIFGVIEQDGVTPLPREVWQYVGAVRKAVLEAVTHLSPPHLSFIFTNYLRGEDEAEYASFLKNVAVADARESLFVPVLLTCETSELMNRIATQSRKERMKLLDPVEGARLNDEVPQFDTDHQNFLRLDTTRTAAGDTARRIVEWAAGRP